ncbi:SDR family NAD(P)-dependent oxidoreductase [candidate division KSB1 bacterium]|nr:SDR family NAD(P)-dependent oxidoreductase [candidate division KSB1 bacterium]
MSEKVALITGAAQRLGRAIALELAQNGCHCIVHYYRSKEAALETAQQIERFGKRAIVVQADLAVSEDIECMFARVRESFGRVDVLVNNAAIFQREELGEITETLWDQTLDINLKGAFFCSQAAAKFMIEQKSGCIINIASTGGIIPYKNHIPYSISKAGLIMLTKCLATACAPYIKVNAIAPSSIVFDEKASEQHTPVSCIPLKRLCTVDEVIGAAKFLVFSGHYITGQVICLDGGRTLGTK